MSWTPRRIPLLSAYGVRWWSRKQRSKRPPIQSFKHPFGGAVCFRDPQEVIDGCIPNHDMLSRPSALGNLNERHRNDMRLRGCTPMDMHPLERENLAVCAARPQSPEEQTRWKSSLRQQDRQSIGKGNFHKKACGAKDFFGALPLSEVELRD